MAGRDRFNCVNYDEAAESFIGFDWTLLRGQGPERTYLSTSDLTL